MKNPAAIYMIDKFIDIEYHPIFKMFKKYYKYPVEYDYICKANKCMIQLSVEIAEDKEIIKILKEYNFKKYN
jgi:hypothetical protein